MGFFLTIEGCEGAGKTTAIKFIQNWLVDRSIPYEQTREPGGTPMGEEIRHILLASHQEHVQDTTELLLMFAARSQNFHEKIKPSMEQGKVVLCDRFTDATYAYQGGGRGIDPARIAVLEELVQGACRPDMTLLLDVEPAIGLKRARGRGAELDRIEQEDIEFFERVRAIYLKRASDLPQQYVIIDAACDIESVKAQIKTVLEQRLGEFL